MSKIKKNPVQMQTKLGDKPNTLHTTTHSKKDWQNNAKLPIVFFFLKYIQIEWHLALYFYQTNGEEKKCNGMEY